MADVPDRDALEKKLARKISKVFSGFNKDFMAALEKAGWDPFDSSLQSLYPKLTTAQKQQLAPFLENIALAQAEAMMDEFAVGVDWEQIHQAAADWAKDYTVELAGKITETTTNSVQNSLRNSIASYFEEGLSQGELQRRLASDPALEHLFKADVKDKLGRVFGPQRAEMIARTEVTRAAVEGERKAAEAFGKLGLNMVEVWHTRNDEIVCAICGPRNGQPEANPKAPLGGYWEKKDGPPAHPRCRCFVGYEYAKKPKGV